MTLEEYFSTGPDFERPVFEAVLAHLEQLGPIHVEPVSVGLFLKSTGSFVELRPMTRWVAMSFPTIRELHDRRITRKPVTTARGFIHFVNLRGPEDLDEVVKDWLTESYAAFG